MATPQDPEKAKKEIYPIKDFIQDELFSLISETNKSLPTPELGADTKVIKRLIIVGDVHGMHKTLSSLLETVNFQTQDGDQLMFVGDLVNKGPDSAAVIDLAIQHSAMAVRGNHENAVLVAWSKLRAATSEAEKKHLEETSTGTSLVTAKLLSTTQIEWLASLPLMIRVQMIPPTTTSLDRLVLVHAGLVPGMALENQDAHSIIHMRSLSSAEEPLEADGDESWAASWDRWQKHVDTEHRTTVVFGHDAKRGLNIRDYAIGLDSACVYGKELSALIIESGADGQTRRTIQVECRDAAVDMK